MFGPDRQLEWFVPLFYSTTAAGRVLVAAVPFACAVAARLVFGANRLTKTLVFVTVAWFTLNILMAPFRASIRQDYLMLRSIFR